MKASTVRKISVTPIVLAISLLIGAATSYAGAPPHRPINPVCKSLDNGGRLCIDKIKGGYKASYANPGGKAIVGRFVLKTESKSGKKHVYYSSYQRMKGGGSSTWYVGNQGCAKTTLEVRGHKNSNTTGQVCKY